MGVVIILSTMYISFLDGLQALLKDIRFSPKGSSERVKEESTYMYFIDFLNECEGTC